MKRLPYAGLFGLTLMAAAAGCGDGGVADTSPERTDGNSYGDGSVSGDADGNDSSGGQGREPDEAPATQ